MQLPPVEDLTVYAVITAAIIAAIEIAAVLSAVHALMAQRTSQGAIAWSIALVTFPFLTLPAYWVLGRSRFEGYVKARREGNTEMHRVLKNVGHVAREKGLVRLDATGCEAALERLAWMPFTRRNRVDLLIDGQATFDAIFAGIDSAKNYVLIQFFIVKDDELGNELKRRVLTKASEGVRVYFVYDEVGSHRLPKKYLAELRDAGVEVSPFNSTRRNRFQINFRNHRKIVVIDGRQAFVGGLNVGDEYVGRSEKFGAWRDTHAELAGPSVLATQLSFLEDWYWATHEVPDLNWTPEPAVEGDKDVLVLPTGPADSLEGCGLFFMQMISVAQHRLWIASPYFVPDLHVIAALQLAALRGVDVRIMLPEKPDHLLVYLSSFSFLKEMEDAGVQIYRYQRGFLHAKTLLVDDRWSAIGTANLDNRSFRLNFEITVLVDDKAFASQMAEMFDNDFSQCQLAEADDLQKRSLLFKIGVRLARLMAPIQ